jgi:two-component system response regulator HydG
MMNYDWPGNIRELENLLKRAMINATGEVIMALDLPQSSSVGIVSGSGADPNTPFKDYVSTILRDAEKKYLLRMLEKHKGNINQIAKLMEVDRKTVYRKMSEHSINPSEYRP